MTHGAPEPSDGPRRRWPARLAALGLSLLSVLAVGEIAVRVLYGSPLPERRPLLEVASHPTRGWQMRPGRHYTYTHPVDVNSLGLRGPEPRELAPGGLRVLALGDSLVYGQGVAEQDALPLLLEQRLSAGWGVDVEVLNGGHRAFSTHQSLALLRDLGPELRPDLVLLCWYWNDVDERDIEHNARRLAEVGPVAFDLGWPLKGRRLWKWRGKQLLRKSALVMWTYDQLRASRGVALPTERIEEGLAVQPAYLEAIAAECQAIGARFELVLMPDAAALEGPSIGGEITARLAELARAQGLDPIDPTAALAELTATLGRTPTLPFDGHYDARGNAALADAIAAAILSREPR